MGRAGTSAAHARLLSRERGLAEEGLGPCARLPRAGPARGACIGHQAPPCPERGARAWQLWGTVGPWGSFALCTDHELAALPCCVPRLSALVPLRGEGSCGGGGAPRDSAGSGATEEGLTSRSLQKAQGRGCANCQSLPQAELFFRQRERPGLRSPAVAWPPRLSAGRRESPFGLGRFFLTSTF